MNKIFDKEQAIAQSGGDPALAAELFTMLIKELPDLSEQLTRAHREMNFQTMWDHAHKIRGSTAYCGVPALQSTATALEDIIKQKDELVLGEAVAAVQAEIAKLVEGKDGILAELS
ncbi:MAG: Hpt domain-containing protein [Gammaproteobacteria bacterium]|nr:Hpt domain-containing protein [Gammaproteobacteria bacterium]MDH5652613.1 Hpt domain-containing protein [Gammaproteobacteria bacterium]